MEDGGAAVGAGTTAVGVLNGAVEAAVAGTLRHDMYDEDAHGHLQEPLHRHHMHLPSTRRSGTGLIWFLVLLHLAFVGYWVYAWYRNRPRVPPGKKEPERVNCVYEFAEMVQLPQLRLGLGTQAEKIP